MRNFTDNELELLKLKLDKFKIPWFSTFIFKLWFKYKKYIILPMFILILILGLIYLIYNINMLIIIIKSLFLILTGNFMLLFFAMIYEIMIIKYYQKKLNLDDDEWDYLINLFNVKKNDKE